MGFDTKLRPEVVFENEDRSWAKSMKGFDTCRSITLDSSAFAAAHLTAKGAVPSGTVLEKLASGLYGPYTGNAAANEVQVITESDGTDGGSLTVTVTAPDGSTATTAAIAWDATAQQFQDALSALANVEKDDITVVRSAGGAGAFVFTLTFGGSFAGTNVATVTTDNALTTDGGVQEDDAITVTTAGVPGAAGLLFTTTVLGDGTGADLATAGDVGTALFWEGIVNTNKLPTFTGTDNGELDAEARTALNHIRFED